ncbi:MAG: aminopeptidase P family protein [Lachnospiraceae bacterium]|nr:aminopeptidase P family protein [Lachnospiraceae bacterium]
MNRLINIIKENNLDAAIITDGYNIHYLTGYTGHTGCMLVSEDKIYILTDSRYTEQVSIEAPDCECIDVGLEGYSKTISRLLSTHFEDTQASVDKTINIGFENVHISYKQYKAFADEFFKAFGDKITLVELEEKINALRMIKSEKEIEYIAKAEAIGDEAFSHILTYIKPGMTEKEVALELEYTMKKLGAEGLSFDTIAASGANSSLPHAVPTDRVIEEGDFLTMDFGCIYKGYCSDMTRTIFIGSNPVKEQQEVYEIVLKAQLEAMKYIKPGMKCSDIDAVARDIITAAGYGEYFGHGLGHSVGLYIHEEPRFSRKCDTILEEGMVLTVEPGIYLPGKFGVRIEDLILVTKEGYKNLTTSPKELICIK